MNTPNAILQQLKTQSLLCTLLGSCGICVLLVLCWFGFANPILRDQREAADQQLDIALLQSQESQIEAKLVQTSVEAKYWQKLDEKRCQRSSPQQDDSCFLRWLNQQAAVSGLQVKDFRPLAQQKDGDYTSQGFAIVAQGNYKSVCQFLDAMRNCPKMNRITNLDLTPKDAGGESFTMTIQGLLFTDQTTKQPQTQEG